MTLKYRSKPKQDTAEVVKQPTSREYWAISISGYGVFLFHGTKGEAKARRASKAEWEGGVGRIMPLDADWLHRSAKLGARVEGRNWRKSGC